VARDAQEERRREESGERVGWWRSRLLLLAHRKWGWKVCIIRTRTVGDRTSLECDQQMKWEI